MKPKHNPFADQSAAYARARPRYPGVLFEWLRAEVAGEDVWDCATGNGQAALALAGHFERVTATDVSPEQLSEARPHDRVAYTVATAEDPPFEDGSFDLVTAAQALHWFDHASFWKAVRRVARPGALFCAWGYSWFTATPAVDARILEPMKEILDPLWREENRVLMRGYRAEEVAFPFVRLETPKFVIEIPWTYSEFVAYLETQSACRALCADPEGKRRWDAIMDAGRSVVAAGERMPVRIPLHVIAGRVG